jgi:hypothetical protein
MHQQNGWVAESISRCTVRPGYCYDAGRVGIIRIMQAPARAGTSVDVFRGLLRGSKCVAAMTFVAAAAPPLQL